MRADTLADSQVGHTMLVRNRCDAALVLQQRLAQNMSQAIGRAQAAQRVAAHVWAMHGNGTAVWKAAVTSIGHVSAWKGRHVTLEEAVEGCADGLFEPKTEQCNEALTQSPDSSRTRRARAYSHLAGHNMLDFHNMVLPTSSVASCRELTA